MSEIRVNRLSNELNTGGPTLSGITTFSGQQYFVPPSGSTAERPSDCPPGSIRFNTDSAHLEYFDGLQWLEFEATSEELGGGTGSNTGLGTRAIWGGGSSTPTTGDIIDYVTITTLGNAQDFGNLTAARQASQSACSSRERCLWGGGYGGSGRINTIDYVTIASTGNAQNFADLLAARTSTSGGGNQTRGIFAGGNESPGNVNTIEYVTISSIGVNAQDSGDLTASQSECASAGSPVRGLTGRSSLNIDYITFSTLGNAQDFGTISNSNVCGAVSSATRAVFAGEYIGNKIHFVTIASLGNSQDFGDLTVSRFRTVGASSPTRGVFGGGSAPPSFGSTNLIDYITIATTGDALDFGDLTRSAGLMGAGSNGHGGL